jgi:hypothetical protein
LVLTCSESSPEAPRGRRNGDGSDTGAASATPVTLRLIVAAVLIAVLVAALWRYVAVRFLPVPAGSRA